MGSLLRSVYIRLLPQSLPIVEGLSASDELITGEFRFFFSGTGRAEEGRGAPRESAARASGG